MRRFGCLLLCAALLCGSACAQEAEDPFLPLTEAYRQAMHSDYRHGEELVDLKLPYSWYDYADDPASAPAYARVTVDGKQVMLIGDAGAPLGQFDRMYSAANGDILCVFDAVEGGWYLRQDGQVVDRTGWTGEEELQPIAWVRFWNSRKAIVTAEKAGGTADRRTPEANGEYLGPLETGTVIVVDDVVDGFAWFRFRGMRDDYSASCDGYAAEADLMYAEQLEPVGQGTLSKNGKTAGKATINIRFRPTTQSRKIAELPVGTEVDIYSHSDGWYEIEWNRMHGYVKDSFLIGETQSGE